MTYQTMLKLCSAMVLLASAHAQAVVQVFACELATARGYDVDQPRNLAKSVTVE